MPLYLPQPYPDELIYSVLARASAWLGLPFKAEFADAFEGRHFSFDLPHDLSSLERHAGPTFKGRRVLQQMTLFPYYTSFMAAEMREKFEQSILLGSRNSTGSRWKRPRARRINPPRFMRGCGMCFRRDMEEFGETCWRRSHQIGGVVVCVEHGEPLVELGERFRGRTSSKLADATTAWLRNEVGTPNAHLWKLTVVRQVARRCVAFLNGQESDWSLAGAGTSYAKALRHRGFERSDGSLALTSIRDAFVRHFDPAFLAAAEIQVDVDDKASWFRSAMREGGQGRLLPLEHALMRVFLESEPERQVRQGADGGKSLLKCPNRFVDHDEGPRILKRVNRDGIRRFTAACQCGCRFRFRATAVDDPGRPMVTSFQFMPASMQSGIRDMHGKGATVSAISSSTGVPEPDIAKCLDGLFGWGGSHQDDVSSLRQEFLQYLAAEGQVTLMQVRRSKPNLFRKLQVLDRTWLRSKCIRVRSQHGDGLGHGIGAAAKTRTIDWKAKDARTFSLLSAAIAEMKVDPNGPRRSAKAICGVAGIPQANLRHQEHLPRTTALIKEESETTGGYYERRAVAHIESCVSSGTVVNLLGLRKFLRLLSSQTNVWMSDEKLVSLIASLAPRSSP